MIDENGSFRDPAGKIYYEDNRVLRKLTTLGIERFLKLENTNIISKSIKKGFFAFFQISAMPACTIPGCKSGYATQSDGKKFMSFQLPKSAEMKEKWISKIYRDDFFPTKNTIICSKHFLEEDFVPDYENLTTKGKEKSFLVFLKVSHFEIFSRIRNEK